MNFLLLCSQYPVPANSGSKIRTLNIAKALSEFGEVDIVYFYSDDEYPSQQFRNTYKLKVEGESYSRNLLTRFKHIWNLLPWNINYLTKNSLLKFKNIIKNCKYDAIVIRYVVNSYCVNVLRDKITAKIIIDYDDILSEIYKIDGPIYRYNTLRKYVDKYFLKRLEHKCLGYDAALFCSKNDIVKINAHNKSCNVYVLPNTIDIDNMVNFDYCSGYMIRDTLIFVGALDYQPNIDSLIWFVESILDKIVITNQNIKLLIVGKNPSKVITDLANNRNYVELYPNVQDVREYYDRAGAIIVPITTGAGTRIKILEGALTHRPIFSTRLGAYGLEFYNDTDILFFENESEFAEQYKKIDDDRFYVEICERAKINVINNYGIKYMTNTFKVIFKQLELII